jgi:hypothetical protein
LDIHSVFLLIQQCPHTTRQILMALILGACIFG